MNASVRLALGLGLLAASSGCAHVVVFGHTVHEMAAPPAPAPPDAHPAALRVGSIELEFGTAAVQALALDAGFQPDAQLQTLRATLRSRGVLAAEDPATPATARVLISGFEVHPSTNAVVFGYRLGSGLMTAELRIEAPGGPVQRVSLTAPAQLRVPANGAEQPFPLGPLYSSLAERVADQLAGTPHRSEDAANALVPR